MKFTRRDALTFLAVSLAIGFFTDVLVRQSIFGLNFLLWSMVWVGTIFWVAFMKKRLRPRLMLFGTLSLINAFIVYIRAEAVVQAWSVIITLVLLLLMAGMLYAENFLQLSIVNRIIEYCTSIVAHVVADSKVMLKVLTGRPEDKKSVKVSSGVIIAAVLALIFIALFSGSDAVFRHQFSFLGNFFSSIGDWLGHYNLGRFVSVAFWVSAAATGLLIMVGKEHPATPLNIGIRKFLSKRDPNIILGTVCAVFGIFILIQIKYLFAGSVLPEHLTYADYARRGYGELLVATMLASAVIYGAIAYTKDLVRTKTNIVLSNLLVILNGIVVVSAWKRLSLYESAYGWTMTRFIARLGLICILLGSVLLLLWVNQKISSLRLFGYSWYAVMSVLMIAAFLNPIGIITKKNITDRASREVKLDTVYMRRLSADSYPAMCKYAPELKSSYPDEYRALTGAPVNGVYEQELMASISERNHGMSAHYTSDSSFIKPDVCLR